MKTLVIGLGRSTKDGETLSREEWMQFQYEAERIVGSRHTYFKGEGTGIWEGVAEESCTIVAGVLDTPETVLELLGRFGVLAHKYRQEAIALTFGDTHLAMATPDFEVLMLD